MTRLVLLAVVLSIAPRAFACSAVLLEPDEHPVVARNYDWHLGHALVIVNQRDIDKRALSLDNPARWTSRHGSVTINQYGRELPNEGMNDAGLAIAVLWLAQSEYPKPDDRPSVNTAQWIQYQLDTATTVEQVVASDKQIRITPLGGAKVHYFVADASGDCAVIEFLEGKQVVHQGDDLPHLAITNNTCAQSQRYLRYHAGFGGDRRVPRGGDSLSRYVRLTKLAQDYHPGNKPVPYAALKVIDGVANRGRTQWQAAYDLQDRRVTFRTLHHRATRELDLTSLDFGNDHPVQVLDLEARLKGDVASHLRDYTTADNRKLVERSFSRSGFAGNLPKVLVELTIRYPEEFCNPATAVPVGQ